MPISTVSLPKKLKTFKNVALDFESDYEALIKKKETPKMQL